MYICVYILVFGFSKHKKPFVHVLHDLLFAISYIYIYLHIIYTADCFALFGVSHIPLQFAMIHSDEAGREKKVMISNLMSAVFWNICLFFVSLVRKTLQLESVRFCFKHCSTLSTFLYALLACQHCWLPAFIIYIYICQHCWLPNIDT